MKADIRRIVAHFAKTGGSKKAGDFGEKCARLWFEREKIRFWQFPQGKFNKPRSLTSIGGKRPDFAVELTEVDPLVYIDAKFHTTNNMAEFFLTETEIYAYQQFQNWILSEFGDDGPRDVLFMLFPKELNGDRFVWIDLKEFADAEPFDYEGQPARRLSLKGRDADLWDDNLPKSPPVVS